MTEDDRESAKRLRATAKGKFTRTGNSLDQAIDAKFPVKTIESRYNELKTAWNDVQEKHEEYAMLLSHEEVNEAWIGELNETFGKHQVKTDRYLEEVDRNKAQEAELKVRQEEEERARREQDRKIDQLLSQRHQEELKVKNLIVTIQELIMTEGTASLKHKVGAVKDARTKLDDVMKACDQIQERYVASLTDKEVRASELDWISPIFEVYNKTCTAAEIFISYNSCQENASVSKGKPVAASGIKLEKLKFDSFKGDLRKYPRFKEQFLKHVKPLYKPDEEAFALRSYLSDEIKEEVDGLGEDIDQIWKRLDKKYGDESKLVDAIMSEIKKLKLNKDGDPNATLDMINVIERAHRDLKSLGLEKEISNSTIVSMIEEKLPEDIEKEWIKLVTSKPQTAKDKFPALLSLLLEFKERIEYKFSDLRAGAIERGRTLLTDINTKEEKPRCWMHPNHLGHPIWKCRVFEAKSAAEKVELIRANNACFACLEQGHTAKLCKRNFKCREDGCGKPHHRMLHEAHASGISFHSEEVFSLRKGADAEVLLQIQKLKGVKEGGKCSTLNTLWDGGSTLSFITFRKAKEMKLTGHKVQLQIVKVGGTVEELESYRYNIGLMDKTNTVVTISVLGIERISTDIVSINIDGVLKLFKDTTVQDLRDRPDKGEIDCLVGYEYAALHPIRKQAVGHLLLLENRFGTVIGGTHPTLMENTRKLIHHGTVHHASVRVEDFYELEQLGIQCVPQCGSCKCGQCHPGGKNMTLKEEREYKLIEENLTYKPEEKKWEAGYPWIKDPKELPDNRSASLGALKATEKRLRQDPLHAAVYNKQIEDMVQRGAARKLTEGEINEYNGPVFYIAHHEVIKPESTSTPCRIVFNSSANFHGHVLNEYYAKGPDMLNNLLGVLLRFREEAVAMIGDISKMFHSIDTPILDQMTHRFLWRNMDERKEPDTYVMTAVNMGDRPSGTIAMMALRKTAEMSRDEFPRASETILKNSYMDDIPESTGTMQEAVNITTEIDGILENGGFKIKGWTRSGENQGKEQNDHPENQEQDQVHVLTSHDPVGLERVLGMNWNPVKDVLCYQVKLNFSKKRRKIHTQPNLAQQQIPSSIPEILSKRLILSQVNGIYDPMGLMSPFTVRAKIMLRKLWGRDEKLDWDDAIPDRLRQEWLNFFQELFELEKIEVLRCIKPDNAVGDPVLVIFSDGSGDAYGAVAYARWKIEDGTYEARLITSKNRIAPIKIVDIVRLELSGAVISKRLREFIESEIRYTFASTYHIVDSEIVKAMINKESYGFNTFAANRIGEIQQKTDPTEWYWIAGDLNIADWLTRGKSPKELGPDSLWQTGPEFLKWPLEEWPISCQVNVEKLPERHKVIMAVVAKEVETLAARIDISRFSKIEMLKNTTARILKLYERYRRHPEGSTDSKVKMNELTVADRDAAERFWIQNAQESIVQEVQADKFNRLCPKYKEDLIVVGGRAERWMQATWNRQEFILLPYDHQFSRLIAEEEHRKSGHLGVAATVARIRSRFWIVNLQRMVKSICNKCVTCKRKFQRLSGQVMSDLPVERLQPSPPFSTVGVDFFGPFTIRGEVQKRVRGKCYGVIFVCFTSRAVHVDVSKDYSTDRFLQVLRRFASIRGWPSKLYSDCGTQLVAASKELKEAITGLDWDALRRYGVQHRIEWNFAPADAPWMNGVTEALVKSAKKALNGAIGDQVMDFSELQTVMFEAAQIVNQRPIGRHPTSPDDGSYLCPNDLLLGRASPEVPQGPFKERVSDRYRLDFIQKIVEGFWKKWTRDYFPGLIVRSKWHVERRNVKKGDVVLVQDSNALRGEWKLGIVTDVHPSHDDKVRRVTVSYKHQRQGEAAARYTSIERAVHRLIVLVPVNEDV